MLLEASASCRWTMWAGFHYQGTALKVGFAYSYVYNYTDHLGNIRLSYAQDPENPNVLKILEESHYYPFGLKHSSGNMTAYGLPQDSPTDVLPENNRGYTEPSVVLGYKEQIQSLLPGQIGGTPQVNYTPTAEFYDTNNNPIITVPFSDLQSAIKKINAQ